MRVGMYFNSIICLLIFGFSLYTAYYIYKNNKQNLADVSFAGFWFFEGLTWLLVAISLVLYKNSFFYYDILLNQFGVQTVIFLQMVAGIYFVISRVTRNKVIPCLAFIFAALLSVYALYFSYQPGSVYATQSTYISVEYKINDIVWQTFQVIFVIVMIGLAIDFIRNTFYWFTNNKLFEQRYFFACLSVLIYGMIGYFDQSGVSASWLQVLFRSAIILCANIAYLAYSEQEEKWD